MGVRFIMMGVGVRGMTVGIRVIGDDVFRVGTCGEGDVVEV